MRILWTHITVRKGQLEHLTFTRKIKGNNSRGRPRMMYITGLRKRLKPNLSIEKLVHEAYHRSNWKHMISNARIYEHGT